MAHIDVTLNSGNTDAENTAFKQLAFDRLELEDQPDTVAEITDAQLEECICEIAKQAVNQNERRLAKKNATTTF